MKLQVYRATVTEYLVTRPKIKTLAKGDYYVRLKADNGRVLMHSDGYKRKASAMRMALNSRHWLHVVGIEDLTGEAP